MIRRPVDDKPCTTMKLALRSELFFTTFTALLTVTPLAAQNLVPNAGFEDYDRCPGSYTQDKEAFKIPGWFSATAGTPDHFHACSQGEAGVPYNWAGVAEAYEGQAYAGLYAWSDNGKSYREYLQCSLTTPLVKDSVYHIAFRYKLSSYSMYAIDRIGLHLVDTTAPIRHDKVLKLKPALSVVQDSALTLRTGYWETATTEYQARGGEKYLLIGNFSPDEDTHVYKIQFQPVQEIMLAHSAYYYIDDVQVIPHNAVPVEPPSAPVFLAGEVERDKDYVLRNIQFEFDSYKLLPSSFEELDQLVGWLEMHPGTNVQFSGHTDDVGGDRYNHELSFKRAQTVAAYCTSQGIAPSRIEIFSYGKRKPLVAASTEEARQLNRRVEARFVE